MLEQAIAINWWVVVFGVLMTDPRDTPGPLVVVNVSSSSPASQPCKRKKKKEYTYTYYNTYLVAVSGIPVCPVTVHVTCEVLLKSS